MAKLERYGMGGVCDRELSLLELLNLDDLPLRLSISGPHFACFVALDACDIDAQTIGKFAESLLSQGAVYVCAWGPDCERVHDIFDGEIVGSGPEFPRFDIHVMTSWHTEETLDEALWFFLDCTFPDEKVFDTCRSAVVISVANSEWSVRAREALSSPGEFCRQVVDRDGAP